MELGTQIHQGLVDTGGFRPIYAIFEGGGAKGIAHVGALKALEQEQLAIAGVAGSSAGAIIAALTAVGYQSDELFEGDGGGDILQRYGVSPIGLLGRGAWLRFRLIRRLLPVLLLVALLAAVTALVLVVRRERALYELAALVTALACVAVAAGLVWPVLRKRGLFDSTRLRGVLNRIILDKLNAHRVLLNRPPLPPDHKVTFNDLNPATTPACATLKIIVADVRSGKLCVFDHTTPEVVVADAVAASASIPFAFQPPPIEGLADTSGMPPIYVDGGLISNLPVWSFRAEKRALERDNGGPPIPIIAFSLGEPKRRPTPLQSLRPLHYLIRVIQTGIFGSQQIVQRFVPDLAMIVLRCRLDTMRFNCSRSDAAAAMDAGYRCAFSELLRLRRIAATTTRVLESVVATVAPLIARQRQAQDLPVPRLRANLIEPIDERATAFRVVASVGMSGQADDRLELDSRNHVAPQAFRQGLAQLDMVRGVAAADLKMTKYEHALVCPELHSIISVPVFAPRAGTKEPERVLCIDSTDSLADIFTDSEIMESLQKSAIAASRSLILRSTGVN